MLVSLCLVLCAGGTDENAVRRHIMDHYIHAMYTAHDENALRSGFHTGFRMIVWWQGQLTLRPRDAWIEKVMHNPAPSAERAASIRVEIPVVWVVGDAAAARIEIYRGDQHRYTDFFTLYRIEDQWQVMAKSFHYHPQYDSEHQPAADRTAIENLIEERYLKGFTSGFSAENMRMGFHRDFRMVTWWRDELTIKDRETWIAKITRSKATPEHRAKWSWRIPAIEIMGDAAMARIELSHDRHLMFTDYFLLYRFPEGWRIMEKSFHYAPKPGE